ncbi:toll-like receptor 21 [Eucyclogobius newberryi]|uniref:toll-like receptor 21 n=1 Tax=Eucyclogobius newberryi TaxID=166745 RepID=UPI003B5A772D
MTSLIRQLLVVTAVLHAVHLVTSYSFNNCIKYYGNTFSCWRRKEGNVTAVVGDLPPSAINLAISFKRNIQGSQMLTFILFSASDRNLPQVWQVNKALLWDVPYRINTLTSLRHSDASLPSSLSELSSLGCHNSSLSNLKYLDLSFNPISTEAFQGVDMSHLNNFRLQDTNVNIIHLLNNSDIRANSVDFSNTGLKNDSLLEEFCKILGKRAKHITNLRLNNNLIGHMSSTSLQYCPEHIERLDLSRNRLHETNCLLFLNRTKDIQVFKAEHNRLSKLVSCNENKVIFENLTDLSYRYNRILTVSDNAFNNTPNLVNLSLNINSIAWFGRWALTGLKKLQHLRLDQNIMTDLYHETFQDQINLEILNLNSNRISVIFCMTFHSLGKLKTLDLGGNKITPIKKKGFHGLTSLLTLILDDNNLIQIDTSLYYAFSDKLKVLSLKSNTIRFMSETINSPFLNLSQLNELNLDAQRPYGLILLPHFFRGLHSLKNLSLTNNHISKLASDAFAELTELQYLTLNYCCVGVLQLQPGVFKNLKNLTRLVVENMGLQNFSKDVFGDLTKLESLQLNRNVMHSIDVDILKGLPHLHYMDIRSVPLSCTCENLQLQNWTVNNPDVQVVYIHDHPCQESTKHRFYNFDTKVCYVDFGLFLCFTTAAAVFVFTLVPIIYTKLYWTFKYSYFVFRAWFGERWRRLRDKEENCAYDAFISYNSSDEQWVMEELVPNLEGNGSSFKLCLHHRDFEVGRNIVDNIVSAVYSSRKTLCVVSRNFLRSEWCSLEIQLASYRLFNEHRDVLLLVFLETISQQQISSYHQMRKVMLKKTYLQWPRSDCTHPAQAQKLFWTQLRRAMKESGQCETDQCKSGDSFYHKEAQRSEMSDETHYLQP